MGEQNTEERGEVRQKTGSRKRALLSQLGAGQLELGHPGSPGEVVRAECQWQGGLYECLSRAAAQSWCIKGCCNWGLMFYVVP